MSTLFRSPVPKSYPAEDLSRQITDYVKLHDDSTESGPEAFRQQATEVSTHYHNLATDFYQYGWGESFHFAPRRRADSFVASLCRHQQFLAKSMDLKPGMKVLDVGCGVGGPMREIVKSPGVHIVGLNINSYQLRKCEAPRCFKWVD